MQACELVFHPRNVPRVQVRMPHAEIAFCFVKHHRRLADEENVLRHPQWNTTREDLVVDAKGLPHVLRSYGYNANAAAISINVRCSLASGAAAAECCHRHVFAVYHDSLFAYAPAKSPTHAIEMHEMLHKGASMPTTYLRAKGCQRRCNASLPASPSPSPSATGRMKNSCALSRTRPCTSHALSWFARTWRLAVATCPWQMDEGHLQIRCFKISNFSYLFTV